MLRYRSHWLSIAVMLAWIALTAGCSSYSVPIPPAAPSATTPSPSSGSVSVGATVATTSTQFTVTPAVFSFPATAIGTTSSTNGVATLTSSGNAIQLIAITSSNPSEFPVTTTCSLTNALAPNVPCLVSIQFMPSSAGTRSAQITITTTNAGRVSLAMSGDGVSSPVPEITISPGSFAFPNTVVGGTFAGGVITLTNTGTVAVNLTTITSSDLSEFPITTTCNLPGSLIPGASCTVLVQFRPSVGGIRSAQMVIVTSNAGSPTFSVSGAGM